MPFQKNKTDVLAIVANATKLSMIIGAIALICSSKKEPGILENIEEGAKTAKKYLHLNQSHAKQDTLSQESKKVAFKLETK